MSLWRIKDFSEVCADHLGSGMERQPYIFSQALSKWIQNLIGFVKPIFCQFLINTHKTFKNSIRQAPDPPLVSRFSHHRLVDVGGVEFLLDLAVDGRRYILVEVLAGISGGGARWMVRPTCRGTRRYNYSHINKKIVGLFR